MNDTVVDYFRCGSFLKNTVDVLTHVFIVFLSIECYFLKPPVATAAASLETKRSIVVVRRRV